jgi:CDP-glucose 4,6-dehydratase
MKNVLITGGMGFLGSYIIKRILPQVETLTIVTKNFRQKTTFSLLNINSNKINIVKGNIEDFNFIESLFQKHKFDTVFHLGASSLVKKCQSDPKSTFNTNIMGTVNILEASRVYKKYIKSIIVSSTDKLYGNGSLPYQENNPLNSRGIYEVSKSCTDLISQSYYYNYNLPIVITRCSNLYGSADVNFSRIIPNTIKLLLKGESPIIWKGSEDAIREFLYVEDAVDGYLELIRNIQTTKGQSFNIGSEQKITIKDLVNMLIFKINKNLNIKYKVKDFLEVSHSYSDSSKIKNYTKWEPKTKLSDGLNNTIQFYKNQI